MSTIISLFVLPIGIVIFFWDRRNEKAIFTIFEHFIRQTAASDLDKDAKAQRIVRMFLENDYQVVERSGNHVVAERKHFNLGLLFICFGVANYFGLVGYLLYYRFVLRPRRLCADIGAAVPLSDCA